MYKEVFANRLKNIRLEIEISQAQVARELNISRTCLVKYENGQLEPNIETIGKIAEYYNVSIDWLFGRAPKANKIE